MGDIIFESEGLWTTIQDKGRYGYADQGIPISGPMDQISFELTNRLLRKKSGSACIEIYMGGLKLKFSASCQIGFYGAQSEITIGDKLFLPGQIIPVAEGDTISISPFKKGQWLYLAINGTIECEKVLGSQCFYQNITDKARFSKGNTLKIVPGNTHLPHTRSKLALPQYLDEEKVEVYPGPAFSLLSATDEKRLFGGPFTLSKIQNRMAIQLNELLPNRIPEQLSSPVYPGTVQLTPAGRLLVMMKDAQVTGGYPRILQLTEYSMAVIAQKRPNQPIYFKKKNLP
jgi:biotin-dependent carboxylase-like uncharacterized protein